MSDYVTRMHEEHVQLIERLEKLEAFLGGGVFKGLSEQRQGLLVAQRHYMGCYAAVLAQRIELVDKSTGA